MEIHIKTSDKFKTHTNRELKDRAGKPMRFHSERDYNSELKKRGLERYDESKIKKYEPKKYSGISDDAKRMMNQVTYDKSGKPNIGDRYYEKLKSMGVREVPKNIRDKTSGGMYGS